MADVFISYSREDRARVRLIAETLEAEGLSLWWDPEILPGTTFDEVIDRELDSAKCVIVAWSEKSRQSRWVREEANDALEREVLVPVMIEQVPLPRGFKLVQTENLADWRGDRASDAWQRIMLQVSALTGKDVVRQPESKQAVYPEQRLVNSAADAPPIAGRGADITVLLAALIIGGAWFFGTQRQSAYWTGIVALAGLAFILFRLADNDLSPGLKAIASRWFLPVEGKVQISSIEAFNNMFEAVFGKKQLSWNCIWRSATASTASLLIVLLFLDCFLNNGHIINRFESNDRDYIINLAPFIVANIIGDYFSLWETRILLRIAVKRPNLLVTIVVLDFVLTLSVFAAFLIVAVVTVIPVATFWVATSAGLDTHDAAIYLGSGIATAYITSVWLWLALAFGPIARLVVWSRKTGLTAVGRLLDAQRKPFTALGYVAAVFDLNYWDWNLGP